MKEIFLLLLITFLIQVTTAGQQNRHSINDAAPADTNRIFNKPDFLKTETSYIGDFAGNFSGGNRRGATYLGIANIKISFQTGAAGLWKGGEFFINGAATHGGTPSRELLGDFQVASNIEAGNHTYVQELWYKHVIGNFEVIAGLQDLNSEFISNDYGKDFLNSSFGIPSLVSDNVPVPIFPLTALGATLKFQISNELTIKTAIYDGLPDSFDKNEYNINWNLNPNDGALFFSEFNYSTGIGNLPGTLKFGGYYHTHFNETDLTADSPDSFFNDNYGFYLLADQTIFQNSEGNNLEFFTQFAVNPGNLNNHNFYFGGGLNYHGLFSVNGEDALGLAVAHAGFNDNAIQHETTLELFYKTTLTDHLFIQPDFQYIINPAGTDNKLDNALAAFIRFGIDF